MQDKRMCAMSGDGLHDILKGHLAAPYPYVISSGEATFKMTTLTCPHGCQPSSEVMVTIKKHPSYSYMTTTSVKCSGCQRALQ